MPSLNTMTASGEHFQIRVLAYGPPKSKKTWWAGTAAEAGYNMIVLDGDDGAHILTNLSEKAKEQVSVVNIVDTLDRAVMCVFMAFMKRGKPFIWNETKKTVQMSIKTAKPEHTFVKVDPSLLTYNDVLVIDSWTALSWSLAFRYSIENGIDLSAATEVVSDWDGYRWCGMMADEFISSIRGFPCHMIVIGHQDKYDKKKTGADGKQTTEWSRMQIKSTSGPHAMRIADKFSEILFFRMVGEQYRIDTRAEADRDGGGRLVKPAIYKWDEITFQSIADRVNIKPTGAPLEAFKFFGPGELTADDLPEPKKATPIVAKAKPKEAISLNALQAINKKKD